MNKGIIYIMTTAVSGLIKIGQTGSGNYEERMRFLQSNGYRKVTGLQRFFAIETADYVAKELLVHEIFEKHRVGTSELFALDEELAKQLLSVIEGVVVFPKGVNQEEVFDETTENRRQSALFSFYAKGIRDGEEVVFSEDNGVVAVVCNEREVEYQGIVWKLSPLVRQLKRDRGTASSSEAYQGANYFMYNGVKLKDIPNKK